MPGKEQTLKDRFQLTNDEYQELALFKYRGRDLYTGNCIFRDHISAARLRLCLKEMDQLDPKVFKRRVIYLWCTLSTLWESKQARQECSERAIHGDSVLV